VWEVARHPTDPETIFVGVEPAALFISRDGGEHFSRFGSIDALPSRADWTFFHKPFFAGHVHAITVDARQPERILAAVEVGALIHSSDGGKSWAEALVGGDVHRLAVDPQDPTRILAGTGEGMFESRDDGKTWAAVTDLSDRYVHAVLFDPHLPSRVYAYVNEDRAPLWRSEDRGRNWSPLPQNLPAGRSADAIAAHPTDAGVLFYGAIDRLFASTDAGESWRIIKSGLPHIWRVRIGQQDLDAARRPF
jgi:photosystem II stability/assembly factor-like uncharacterized protein